MASFYNYNSDTLITGTSDNDSIRNYGDNVTIKAGDNDDYVYNGSSASLSVIDVGAGNDSVWNDSDSVTINGNAGNDYIRNYGDSLTIYGGAGNDTIFNDGDNVTIDASLGNNVIGSYGKNVLVLVNSGRNTVEGNATINTGTGNSTLKGDRDVQVYQYGGGNDVITNYSGEDIIHIAQGKLDSYSFDGGDLIFHIGDGSIRLKNMTNHAITVKDSTGKTTTQIYGNGYSPQQVIKNLVAAWNKTLLTDTAKLDESIKLCSQFGSIQEVIDKMVSDCRTAGDADTFLRDYCGIFSDNDDTGVITGWDAGGLSIKISSDIVDETLSSLKHVPDYTNTTFKTSQGVTINISSTGDSLTADGKKVFDGLYSWWAEEIINLIEESYGIEFNEGHTIYFSLTPSADYWGHTSGGKDVIINMGSTNFYDDGDYQGNGVDRTIAHEFTHVAQSLFMGRFPKFMQEGFADLTCGVDDRSGKYSQIESLACNAESLASYLDINNYSTASSYHYAAGYMFFRYLAKQVSDSYDSSKSYAWKDGSSITGTDNGELLTGSGKNITISAGKGNDTITVYGKNMKAFGDDDNDYILIGSVASNAKVYGGAGDDSIENYGNTVTINAGDNDDYVYNGSFASSGVIDVGAGNDSVRNWGNNVTIDGGNGNDSIRNDGDNVSINGSIGNDTIRNGGYNISIVGGNGDDSIENYGNTVTINAGDNDDYVYNGSSASLSVIDVGAGNDSVRNWSNNVIIDGGDGADSIRNDGDNVSINGGIGNDTIRNGSYSISIAGGAGDDSIRNEGNNVTIDSGAGNDSIRNYGNNVKINAGDGDDSIENSGSSVTISGNNGDDTITNRAEGAKSSINGGAGNDSINNWAGEIWNEETQKYDITPSPDNVTIVGGTGNDTIYNEGSKVSINGGENKDLLINGGYWESERGGSQVSIHGSSGNDTIISHGSRSVLNGGSDNDLIYNGYRYYRPSNTFYASDSDDYNGNDTTIIGGTGNDTIKNSGNNVVFVYSVGNGNDLIEGFNQTSKLSISGGAYTLIEDGNDIIVNVGKNNITLKGAGDLSAVNVEGTKSSTLTITNAMPSSVSVDSEIITVDASKRTKAVKITGNSKNNTIIGGKGADKLLGGAGNDSLNGGDGKDTLSGGSDNDKLLGGAGNDSLNGGDGKDTLSGGTGDDKLLGGAGNDSLNGGDGNDTLSGYTGDDKLLGGAGNDSLNGGSNNDKLYGGNGNDTLIGGKGNDSLWGDSGADAFIYASGDGKDIIYGFDNKDTLTLDGLDFTSSYKNNAVTLKFSSGSVTFKDFTATTFHIDNNIYKISSSKLVKQ